MASPQHATQYQTLSALLDAPPLPDGASITQQLERDGTVTEDPTLAAYGVVAAEHVQVPGIDHAAYNDRVYVVDSGNNCIRAFDRGGFYLGRWGGPGYGEGDFADPLGIEVDRDGNVYVPDSGNHRIQKFPFDGVYITEFDGPGSGDGQRMYPSRVDIDSGGNDYVLDTANDWAQNFKPIAP